MKVFSCYFQIIDGHKVVINDTEYSTSDANSSSVFVVRVIDVKPNDAETAPTDLKTSGEESSSDHPPLVRDRESLENSLENEIPKSKEVGKTNGAPEKLKAI